MSNKRKSVISVIQDGRVWRWRFERPTKATVSTMGFLTQGEAAIDARSVAISYEALYQCVQCGTWYAPGHYSLCPKCEGLPAPADWPTYAEVQVICANCGEAKEDEHAECDPFWTGREALRDWWAGGL